MFLNGDDEMLASICETTTLPVVYYGTQPWCTYRAEDIQTDGMKTTFTVHTQLILLKLPCLYWAYIMY